MSGVQGKLYTIRSRVDQVVSFDIGGTGHKVAERGQKVRWPASGESRLVRVTSRGITNSHSEHCGAGASGLVGRTAGTMAIAHNQNAVDRADQSIGPHPQTGWGAGDRVHPVWMLERDSLTIHLPPSKLTQHPAQRVSGNLQLRTRPRTLPGVEQVVGCPAASGLRPGDHDFRGIVRRELQGYVAAAVARLDFGLDLGVLLPLEKTSKKRDFLLLFLVLHGLFSVKKNFDVASPAATSTTKQEEHPPATVSRAGTRQRPS